MMTSSPGSQRVTPSPTFHTIPDASEPPMWWSSSCAVKTETGLPSAAHTLLKFTPAAITRTVTSNAPGSGVCISSSWNASIGSPPPPPPPAHPRALALLADDPCGHRGRELSGLGVDLGDLAGVNGHG